MQISNKQSSEVDALTSEASSAYSEITNAVTKVADVNSQVAVGALQQTSVTEELNVNVMRIKQLADQNSRSLTSIDEQLVKQTQQAQELQQIVGFFRV